jgi:hypothetical protein
MMPSSSSCRTISGVRRYDPNDTGTSVPDTEREAGTDHTNSSTVWPGDDGQWDDYEKFVRQLLSDLKANNALGGMVWDIWNEPDISIFWERSTQQWIDLYIRTHKIIR